jgi:hypothetical protein
MTNKSLPDYIIGVGSATALQGTEGVLVLQNGKIARATLNDFNTAINGGAKQLPAAPAPPTAGSYPVGTFVKNSSFTPGAPFGWQVTTAGDPSIWAPVGQIGPSLSPGPVAANTINVVSPHSTQTVSGVIDVFVQGSGFVGVTARDKNNTILAQGQFDASGLAKLTFDSAGIGAGSQSLTVIAYDQPVGQAFTKSAVVVVPLTVVVPVASIPGMVTTPPPPPTVTPPPATFSSPSQTTGLELWWDFSDGTSVTRDGSARISQVNDKTAHSHNAAQATAGARPYYVNSVVNGLSVARWDSSFGITLDCPHQAAIDNIWTTHGSLMMVVNPRGAGGGSPAYSRLIDKTSWYVGFTNDGANNLQVAMQFSGGLVVWNYPPSSQWSFGGAPFILEVDYDATNLTVAPAVRINGVLQSATAIFGGPSGTYTSDAGSDLFLGTSKLDMDIGAVYIWPTGASAADKTNMRAYLSARWNIGAQTSTPTSTAPDNTNTPTAPGGTQPATSYDQATASIPAVVAQQGQGWACVADYTFGTVGGTVTNMTQLKAIADSRYNGGVTRLNDEWEIYTDFNVDTSCHVFATDHLKLRTLINNMTLFNAQVARCRATAGQGTPDGHDWGSWQGGTGGGGGWDCGVSSGLVRYKRTQKYGYFEWKSQAPPSTKSGAWPANWMIDGASDRQWPPEVDHPEVVINNAPDNSFNSFHNCAEGAFKKTTISGLLDNYGSYHGGFDQSANPCVYGVLWQAGDARGDHFTLYVNQVVVWDGYYPWKRPDGTPAGPAEFISDLAFGGNWAGRLGACSDPTVMPIDYKLYYFRMFAK